MQIKEILFLRFVSVLSALGTGQKHLGNERRAGDCRRPTEKERYQDHGVERATVFAGTVIRCAD